jgi:hypothetical protein
MVGCGDTILTVTATEDDASSWFMFHVGEPTNLSLQQDVTFLVDDVIQQGKSVFDAGGTYSCVVDDIFTFDVYDSEEKITNYDVAIADESVCTVTKDANGALTFTAKKFGDTMFAITTGTDTTWFAIHVGADLTLYWAEQEYNSEYSITPNSFFGHDINDHMELKVYNKGELITNFKVELPADNTVCTAENKGGILVVETKGYGFCGVTIKTETGDATFVVWCPEPEGGGQVVPGDGDTGLSIGYYDYTATGSTLGFAPGNTLTYDICYDGRIVDDFTGYSVESSAPDVCTANIVNGQLTIETLKAGTCTVKITKGEESALFGFESDGNRVGPLLVGSSNLSLGNRETANTNDERFIRRNSGETCNITVYDGITPLKDYTVTMVDSQNTNVNGYTIEDDGSLTLSVVDAGTYTVTITASGDSGKSVEFTFEVVENAT